MANLNETDSTVCIPNVPSVCAFVKDITRHFSALQSSVPIGGNCIDNPVSSFGFKALVGTRLASLIHGSIGLHICKLTVKVCITGD
jgi:hypothetical protein